VSVRQIDGIERRLNWRRQPTDPRDLVLVHGPALMAALPPAATTRHRAEPPIRDQGSLGSCTQNAGSEAMGFVYTVSTGKPDPMFSRLFGYYFCRVKMEGYPPSEDSGCNVRDVFRTYRRFGICTEAMWPYDIHKFANEPDARAQEDALKHQALKFYACLTLHAVKKSIADGWPVIFGFDCFDSLDSAETARTGLIPMPKYGEGSIGGHSMYIDSYDDAKHEVSGINSWGTGWGDHGRFRMPYDYFTQGYASDAHTLRQEEI
jgi:C1A family cysteine protease